MLKTITLPINGLPNNGLPNHGEHTTNNTNIYNKTNINNNTNINNTNIYNIKEYITTIDYDMNIRKEMDKYIQSKKGAY